MMTIARRLRSAAALAAVALVVLLVLWARGDRFGLVAARPPALPTSPPQATPASAATPAAGAAQSGSAAGAPTAAPAASNSTGGVQRCQAAQLVLNEGRAGAAAGHVGAVFVLTNRSNATCYLYGFPGMQMMDALGHPMPTHVLRNGAYTFAEVPPRLVDLTPGGVASFTADWSDVPGASGECPTSASVEVTPPDDTAQLTAAAGVSACPDDVIHVSPVVAGARGVGAE